MSDQPGHDDHAKITRPVWSSARQDEHGDFVTLGGRPRPPGRSRRVGAGAIVAVVALLGGAAAAYAVNRSGAPQRTEAVSSRKSPALNPAPWNCSRTAICSRVHMRFPFWSGGLMPGLPYVPGLIGGGRGIAHGHIVVLNPDGRFQTMDVQRGKVTAVNRSSISVRSADGFSATYAVAGATILGAQRDGIVSVKVGDQVAVQATVSGSKATATSIIDLTLLLKTHKSIAHWNYSSG